MLSNCVFSYVLQHFIYFNKSDTTKNVFSELIKLKEIESHEAFVTDKPVPLIKDNMIGPVEWYYNLFTEEELKDALEKHDSLFPTKVFLVFEQMEPITLGNANKILVRFQVVKREDVDACILKVA